MNIMEKARELTLAVSEPLTREEFERRCPDASEYKLVSRVHEIRWNDRATGAINHEYGPGAWTEVAVFCNNDAPAREVVNVLFPREETQTIGSEIIYHKWWEMKVRRSLIPDTVGPYVLAAIRAGIDPRIGLSNHGLDIWADERVNQCHCIFARRDGLDAVVLAEGSRKEYFNGRSDILYALPQRRTYLPTVEV